MSEKIIRSLVTLTTEGGHTYSGECIKNGRVISEDWKYIFGDSKKDCYGVYVSDKGLINMKRTFSSSKFTCNKISDDYKKKLEEIINSARDGFCEDNGFLLF